MTALALLAAIGLAEHLIVRVYDALRPKRLVDIEPDELPPF